jgi:predicted alpha/beta hydrolase family esterase
MVFIPGWQDSGEHHWQTLWAKSFPSCVRVDQADWHHPDRAQWVARLDQVLTDFVDEPAVLVAHSLGASTVAHWAGHASLQQQRRVKGALLVAPPDVRGSAFQSTVPASGFESEPDWKLPFPSILVASSDDPYCSQERSQALALAWGSQLVTLEHAGHINADSKLGNWEAGQRLLQKLMLA